MSLRTKTIHELFDLEVELVELLEEETYNYHSEVISVYEELYKRINADNENEYGSSLSYIKKKLIFYLVHYGTYLKTQYQKDDRVAESSLRRALKYDRKIPIAHYRLGFLDYKKKIYVSAILHFRSAAKYHDVYSNSEYRLTNQQLYNTQMYLTNSALHLAEEANQALQDLDSGIYMDHAPKLKMSSLYEVIQQNEGYLEANAFTMVTPDGKSRCTKEKCEDIAIDESLLDTIILYFSDREHFLIYNGKDIKLSVNQAEMLRYFLLNTTEQSPATKNHFSEIFSVNDKTGEIPNNTFTQNVRRLERKMGEKGVPETVIRSDSLNNEPVYFYTRSIPYIIMHRIDSTFILDQ
ncbi:tetratricopeptide repeat protein [Lentibacillus sediminis]|uniref:tetratricopeptide repeat protein n=1 Tax=Lentibacillus sediminis TaxID=1940529 RepID=UPI000C1BB79C|nr:tetratricopeptide repeat protein [Lentibacillus sediminis]